MAENAFERAFTNVPNPQLYDAVHEAVVDRTNVSIENISVERHIKAIEKALENRLRKGSNFKGVRTEEWALGYMKDQINVGNELVEEYVSAVRRQDFRDERQLAKDALLDSHLEGEEIEDYDVLLQGINVPDKEHIPYSKRPYMEGLTLHESRKGTPEVTADFIGINQDTGGIKAVRIVEEDHDSEQIEQIFQNAQTFLNENEEYQDFSLEYEVIPSESLRDSNPVPPTYKGNVHYAETEGLEPETEQVIDDLARRDVQSMVSGEKIKARV